MLKNDIIQQLDKLETYLKNDQPLSSAIYAFLQQGQNLSILKTEVVPRYSYIRQNISQNEIETLCPNFVIKDEQINSDYCLVFNSDELRFYPNKNSKDYFIFSRRAESTKDGKPRLDVSFYAQNEHNPSGTNGVIYYGLGTVAYKDGTTLQLKVTTSKHNTRVHKKFAGLRHHLSHTDKTKLDSLYQQHRPDQSIHCDLELFTNLKVALEELKYTANREHIKNHAFGIKQKQVQIDINGLPYITQRNLGYRTLRDVLQQDLSDEVPLNTESRLKLIYNLIKAYKALPNDYAHLDLKPENILVDHDYNIHIIDFGLAKKVGTKIFNACTPGYKAPELLDLQHFLDKSGHNIYGACASQNITSTKVIDYYALGLILSEICGYHNINDTLNLFIKTHKNSMHNQYKDYDTANALWHLTNSPTLGNQILIDMLELTSEEETTIKNAIEFLMATDTSERTYFSDNALNNLENIYKGWKDRTRINPAILCQKAQSVISQQLSLFTALKNIANYFELDLKAQPLLEPSTDSLEQYIMSIRQNHRTNIAFRQQLIIRFSTFDMNDLYNKAYQYLPNTQEPIPDTLSKKINDFVNQSHQVISKNLMPALLYENNIDGNIITHLQQLERNILLEVSMPPTSNRAAGFYSTNPQHSYSDRIGPEVRNPVVYPFK